MVFNVSISICNSMGDGIFGIISQEEIHYSFNIMSEILIPNFTATQLHE